MPGTSSSKSKGGRKVHKVMKEYKQGSLKSGGSGKKSVEPETGRRNSSQRSPQIGREDSKEEKIDLIFDAR